MIQLDSTGAFVARLGESNAPVLARGELAPHSGREAQQAALKELRDALIELAAKPGMREEDGSSRLHVIIEGGSKTRWVFVQRLMQVMAHPDLKIYKMQFRQERSAGPAR